MPRSSSFAVRLISAVGLAGAIASRLATSLTWAIRVPTFLLLVAGVMLLLGWIEVRIARPDESLSRPGRQLALIALTGAFLVTVIPVRLPSPPSVAGALAVICDAIALGTVLLLLTRAAVVARYARAARSGRRLGVLAGAVCFVTWLMVLVMKWPGVMTSDSLDQWQQLHTLVFSDHHPVVHTLWEWLVTRVWDSPGTIAVAQSLTLAAVVGWLVSELAEWGVPEWALACLALASAVSPVNTAYSVTLWKDVSYGTAVLGLFVCMLQIIRTQGRCLNRWTFAAAFVAVALGTATFRHNGPPVTFAVLVTLPFIARDAGRATIRRIMAVTVVLFLFLTAGLPRLLGIRRGASELIAQIELHQIGAVIASGALPADPALRASLERLLPLEDWKKSYDCSISDGIYYHPRLNRSLALSEHSPVPRLWRDLVLPAPGTLLRHQVCVASLVWRVTPDPTAYLFLYQRNLVPNELGLSPRNAFPRLEQLIASYWEWSGARLFPLLWSPAFYLYLTLWSISVLALRRRNAALLVLAVPSLVQSLVLVFGNVIQDVRYQYPVYLVGLFAPALLFVRHHPKSAETVGLVPARASRSDPAREPSPPSGTAASQSTQA